MKNRLRVAVRLKDGSLVDEVVAQFSGVDEVPVMADGDLSMRAIDEDRLRVRQFALAGGRVPHVPDGQLTAEVRERLAVEGVRHITHGPGNSDLFAVRRGNASALLAAM